MRKLATLGFSLCFCLCLFLCFSGAAKAAPPAKSVYDFTLKSIDGQPTPLSEYHGKVLLLVNVASRCGYTPQYTALEALYEKYKDKGLVIVGVPANNFMGQEPGTDAEIKTFCTKKYNVSFPIMSKLSVKGDDKTPLYQFLTSSSDDPKFAGEIKWNFTKFLFDRNGAPLARFEPATKPDSPEVISAIEAALRPLGEWASIRQLGWETGLGERSGSSRSCLNPNSQRPLVDKLRTSAACSRLPTC